MSENSKPTAKRSRRPRPKRLSWRKAHFNVGESVRLYTHYSRPLPPRGTVRKLKKNKWGRISYVVLGSDNRHYSVLLEDLVPDPYMAVD